MDKEQLYQLLGNYLAGRLSPDEKKALEKRIETEKEVQEELELLQLEQDLASVMTDDKLLQEMEQWTAEDQMLEKQQPKTNSGKKKRWLLWLLLLVALGGVIAYKFSSNPDDKISPPSNEIIENTTPEESGQNKEIDSGESPAESELLQDDNTLEGKRSTPPVAQDQVPPKASATQQLALAETQKIRPTLNDFTRSLRPELLRSDMDSAFYLLKQRQAAAAESILLRVDAERGLEYQEAQQYLAYIAFEREDFKKAIPMLEKLVADSFYDWPKMQWYLALAYLADGQEKKGLELLRQIASNSGDESIENDARQILRKIE